MQVEDVRKYYNQECYALKNCLHCPDCLAFALGYYKTVMDGIDDEDTKRNQEVKALVVKFILSVVSSGNLPCGNALSAGNLKVYLSNLLEGKEKLPICHYEFQLL